MNDRRAVKFWGKDEKKAMARFGVHVGLIKVRGLKEARRARRELAEFDVMIADIHRGIVCRKCKAVDDFHVVKYNDRIEDVYCGRCDTRVTNAEPPGGAGVYNGVHHVTQSEWESIIWADEIL